MSSISGWQFLPRPAYIQRITLPTKLPARSGIRYSNKLQQGDSAVFAGIGTAAHGMTEFNIDSHLY
jgi:hypothetical protein